MKLRIVLSVVVMLAANACIEPAEVESTAQVAAASEIADPEGIGTSPSVGIPPRPCGIWKGATKDEAEFLSRSREPDMVQFALPGGLACAHAIQIADTFWPERNVVRYAEQVWRAVP